MRGRKASFSWGKLCVSALAVLTMSGCSAKVVSVNFKINSQPEGAHIVYQATGQELPGGDRWIYLGTTPLVGVHQFSKKQFKKTEKITMKVMHYGYLDQKREWNGDTFREEAEERGVIFWTPKLIPNSTK
ncbi:MAG: hypothetical protein CSA32_00255 [Desulfobulbus propionicus]|nr:MAG: hypothetical protein CSA32_00255 [Desulfobulbus propionicus]